MAVSFCKFVELVFMKFPVMTHRFESVESEELLISTDWGFRVWDKSS